MAPRQGKGNVDLGKLLTGEFRSEAGYAAREAAAKLMGLSGYGFRVKNRTWITAGAWIKSGAWVEVISTNVNGIRYDKQRMRLFVQFKKQKRLSAYDGVPSYVARDMFLTGSMGRFVHRRLKHWFAYQRLGHYQ